MLNKLFFSGPLDSSILSILTPHFFPGADCRLWPDWSEKAFGINCWDLVLYRDQITSDLFSPYKEHRRCPESDWDKSLVHMDKSPLCSRL